MEKKLYNKPELTITKLDNSISIYLNSFEQQNPENQTATPPSGYFNPFNWIK
jgi:hypothetical protein